MASRSTTRSPSAPASAAPTTGLVLPDDLGSNETDFDAAIGLGADPGPTPTVAAGVEMSDDALLTRIAAMPSDRLAALRTALLGGASPAAPAPAVDLAPVGMPSTVCIVLEDNETIPPTGLPLGLNGRAYNLRPGLEANVPTGLLEILDNAVMDVPIQDPKTMQVTGYRKRLRYPYRVVTNRRHAA